ncbi:MAG: hypothetical protein ACRCZF_22485, partial [Gemmataceae bacterium]
MTNLEAFLPRSGIDRRGPVAVGLVIVAGCVAWGLAPLRESFAQPNPDEPVRAVRFAAPQTYDPATEPVPALVRAAPFEYLNPNTGLDRGASGSGSGPAARPSVSSTSRAESTVPTDWMPKGNNRPPASAPTTSPTSIPAPESKNNNTSGSVFTDMRQWMGKQAKNVGDV